MLLRPLYGPSRPIVRTLSLALLACFSIASLVRAQPLADKVPADAMIYIGSIGFDTKAPGYAGSHLQAVAEAAEFQKLVDEVLPKLLERIAKEDRNAGEAVNIAGPILKPMLKYPSAIWIGKPELPAGEQPRPKAGILCKAGPDADAMHQHIQDLLKNAPDQVQQMVKLSKVGDMVAITLGYGAGEFPVAGKSLVGTAGFKSATPNMVPNASFAVYVDVETLVSVADQAVGQFGPPEAQKLWPKVRDLIGFKGIKQFVLTSGFEGKEWSDQFFLAAPEPRTGLLALADPTPLSDAALKSIPFTATLAGATKFDIAKFIGGLKNAVIQLEPNAEANINNAMAEVSKKLGMDFEKDLLATIGDEWVYYTDPMIGGRGLGGLVMINRLKDPAKAEAAFVKMEDMVNQVLAKEIKEKDVSVRFLTTKSGTTTIHYLGAPLISPSWAVKDGYLIVALFPQMVSGAADHLAAGDKSILENPNYIWLRKRLGTAGVNSFAYSDLRQTAPDAYSTWVAISRLSGFADVLGIPAPAMLLPPLNKLMPHLTPAGSITWTDKDGIHGKALSPFPGATLIASDPLGSMQASSPLLISVMLPALNKAREQANRVKSESNLRQIGMAAMMDVTENGNRGTFAATLGELVKKGYITPDVFISPTSPFTPPPAPREPAAAAKWVEENSSYVWLGGGIKTAAPATTILAHENLNGARDGVNLLFVDGHVEWVRLEQAMEMIDAQKRAVK